VVFGALMPYRVLVMYLCLGGMYPISGTEVMSVSKCMACLWLRRALGQGDWPES
jgi:hypothetical protein